MSPYESSAAEGPGAASGLPGERRTVRGHGPPAGTNSVGRPRRSVLQVRGAVGASRVELIPMVSFDEKNKKLKDHLSVLADTGSTARHSVSWRWTAAGELMASFLDASMMP